MPASREFFNAYLDAALWSTNDESTPSGGVPLDENYDDSDLSPDLRAAMEADCEAFETANAADIAERGAAHAGHDFWLTRNGHGCGFWDGDWSEAVGERLTKAAEAFGEVTLYVGDDGQIHF